jgi:hypothetical protein
MKPPKPEMRLMGTKERNEAARVAAQKKRRVFDRMTTSAPGRRV